jgi:uncharacterized protein (TIGR00730 family)
MHCVCVFAGSRPVSDRYTDAARAVATSIARRGWGLVYGGASVGTMGVLADSALAAGAEVQGIIPEEMAGREIAHPRLSRLWVVGTMHERKARMHDLSHAFLTLPGGMGTLDEMFETITWMQLGLHRKPIALLDVDGYWQPIVRWIERAVADGFVAAEYARAIHVTADVEAALDALAPAADLR